MHKSIRTLTVLALLSLAGCSTTNPEDKYDQMTADDLYQQGLTHLEKKRYPEAVEDFEALEARYPFGDYAEKAKLAEIYGYYMRNDWPSAMASADRFIKIHPRHDHIDYAYYMKGLIHFSESVGTYTKYLPMDRAERDVTPSKEAFDAFNELTARFPYSKYTPDAKKRMVYLRNVIAANELHAARFNMDRTAYLAAANRSKYIIEHFDHSPIVEEALFIQVAAYRKLGLHDLAQDSLRVLELNYPNSTFLRELA